MLVVAVVAAVTRMRTVTAVGVVARMRTMTAVAVVTGVRIVAVLMAVATVLPVPHLILSSPLGRYHWNRAATPPSTTTPMLTSAAIRFGPQPSMSPPSPASLPDRCFRCNQNNRPARPAMARLSQNV